MVDFAQKTVSLRLNSRPKIRNEFGTHFLQGQVRTTGTTVAGRRAAWKVGHTVHCRSDFRADLCWFLQYHWCVSLLVSPHQIL